MPEVSSGNTAWVLMSTALVALMVPGLAFFYGGLVRQKSTLNTMLMSLGALALVTVQWVVFGYSLAFGENGLDQPELTVHRDPRVSRLPIARSECPDSSGATSGSSAFRSVERSTSM